MIINHIYTNVLNKRICKMKVMMSFLNVILNMKIFKMRILITLILMMKIMILILKIKRRKEDKIKKNIKKNLKFKNILY